jgi:restriction endonuclease S subunit
LLLRVSSELINSEFFVYLFNSSYGQKQVEQIKSAQATKQTELGVNNLKKILFPLPPINTQNQIANEITKRKEKIKQLKFEAKKNREDAIKEFEEEIFKL